MYFTRFLPVPGACNLLAVPTAREAQASERFSDGRRGSAGPLRLVAAWRSWQPARRPGRGCVTRLRPGHPRQTMRMLRTARAVRGPPNAQRSSSTSDPQFSEAKLGVLDPATGQVASTDTLSFDPAIAANPASGGLVAVASTGISESNVAVY